VQNHGSFVFGRVFKATISSKGPSFEGTCGFQEELDPQRRGNEVTNGKNAKTKRYSRETS